MYLSRVTTVILVGLILLASVKVSPAPVPEPEPGHPAANPDEYTYTGRVPVSTKTTTKTTTTTPTSTPLPIPYYYELGYIEALVDLALRRGDQRQLLKLRNTLVYLGELRKPAQGDGDDDSDLVPVLRHWSKERKYRKQVEEVDRRNLDNSWKSSRTKIGFTFLHAVVLCIIIVIGCRYSKRRKPVVEGATVRVAGLVPGPTRRCPSPNPVDTIILTSVEDEAHLPSAPLVSPSLRCAPAIHLVDVPPPYEEAVRNSARPFRAQILYMEEEPPPFNPEFEKFDPNFPNASSPSLRKYS